MLDELDFVVSAYQCEKLFTLNRGGTRKSRGRSALKNLTDPSDMIVVPVGYYNKLDLAANVNAELLQVRKRNGLVA
ncbi:MAG TPA: hypothetical protein VMV69_07670 [Pirellulales bacterium]|nr:hypothetical protein [Pirellulales bacterium]